MKKSWFAFATVCMLVVTFAGCQSNTKTRKVTVEGPEKKTEIKLETTEKNKD